jgi:hypothetical protein
LLVKGSIDVINSSHKSLLIFLVSIFPQGKRSDGSDTLAEQSTGGLLKGKFTKGNSLDAVIRVDTTRVEETTTRRHVWWKGGLFRYR